MWDDLVRALALVLVLEGILPFVAPGRWRQAIASIAQMDDRVLRSVGLLCMLAGIGVLQLV